MTRFVRRALVVAGCVVVAAGTRWALDSMGAF